MLIVSATRCDYGCLVQDLAVFTLKTGILEGTLHGQRQVVWRIESIPSQCSILRVMGYHAVIYILSFHTIQQISSGEPNA